MTEEEENQAAAYLKLREDVKDLILTTILDEMQLNGQGPFANYMRDHILMSREAEQKIKAVIISQMQRY
jgi:hypothetical protein